MFTIGWMASDLGGIPRGGSCASRKNRGNAVEWAEGVGGREGKGRLPFLLGLQDSMRILDGRIRRNEAADHNGKVAGRSANDGECDIYGRGRNKRGEERKKRRSSLYTVRAIRVRCIFLLPFVREGARAASDNTRQGERGNRVIERYSVKGAVVVFSNAN